jgi:hypothetical protein
MIMRHVYHEAYDKQQVLVATCIRSSAGNAEAIRYSSAQTTSDRTTSGTSEIDSSSHQGLNAARNPSTGPSFVHSLTRTQPSSSGTTCAKHALQSSGSFCESTTRGNTATEMASGCASLPAVTRSRLASTRSFNATHSSHARHASSLSQTLSERTGTSPEGVVGSWPHVPADVRREMEEDAAAQREKIQLQLDSLQGAHLLADLFLVGGRDQRLQGGVYAAIHVHHSSVRSRACMHDSSVELSNSCHVFWVPRTLRHKHLHENEPLSVDTRQLTCCAESSVVAFADSKTDRSRYAVKFFQSESAFHLECALYDFPSHPMAPFLPTLHSIVAATPTDHDAGETPSGKTSRCGETEQQPLVLPPYIVMEAGETLDQWQRGLSTAVDVATAYQV